MYFQFESRSCMSHQQSRMMVVVIGDRPDKLTGSTNTTTRNNGKIIVGRKRFMIYQSIYTSKKSSGQSSSVKNEFSEFKNRKRKRQNKRSDRAFQKSKLTQDRRNTRLCLMKGIATAIFEERCTFVD